MMTIEEVANALHLSASLVYREVHAGHLRAFRFGKRCYRISIEEWERYKAERTSSVGKTMPAPGGHTKSSKGTLRHIRINPQLARQKRQGVPGQDERTAR